MNRSIRIPAILVAAGFVIAATACFAESLGLDVTAGWGRMRIAILVLGLGTVFAGIACGLQASRAGGPGHGSADRGLWASRVAPRLTQWWRDYWFVIPAVAVAVFVYLWVATSGTLFTWDSPTRYYADLARGFLRGRLFMATRDFQVDYVIYNGRYYLYFGPVPAVLLALISPFVSGRVGDLQLTFAFITLTYVVLCLLAVTIWNRFFAALPRYLLAGMLPVLGLAGPAAFILNTYKAGRVYEAAISGGQFFLMAGLLAGVAALRQPPKRGTLVLAGALWCLAIGARWSLAPMIVVMVAGLGGWILITRSSRRGLLADILALTLPLAIGLAALGWYNWARFGSVLETGMYYMDNGTGREFNKPYTVRFNAAYIPHNFYNYLLHPFGIQARFAYLHARDGITGQLLWFRPAPEEFGAYPITGALFAAPIIMFALVPPAMLLRTRLRGQTPPRRRDGRAASELDWLLLTLSAACLAGTALLLTWLAAAPRYAYDVGPCVLLLAVIGFWQGYRALGGKPSRQRVYTALGFVLAAASIVVSTLIALSAGTAGSA